MVTKGSSVGGDLLLDLFLSMNGDRAILAEKVQPKAFPDFLARAKGALCGQKIILVVSVW